MNKTTKHRIKTAFWLVFLTGLGGVSLTAARFQAGETIRDVVAEVVLADEGDNLIVPDEIVGMVTKKFGPLKDLPVDMVDMRTIETYLRTHPYVRDANVYLAANGELVLRLDQRIPRMRVVDNAGRHWYVDADTIRMPVSRQYAARVPVVTGNFPAVDSAAKWNIAPMLQLTELFREDEFMAYLVDQVYVESPDKIWLVPRMGPSRILIGTTDDLADKAERIRKWYRKALPAAGWDTYAYIDTRFAGQIVARRKLNP